MRKNHAAADVGHGYYRPGLTIVSGWRGYALILALFVI